MEYKGRSKDQRRQEGEARNEKWQKFTPSQQLHHLDASELIAKKQRAKIQKLLEKPKLSAKQAVAILAAVAVSLPSPLLDQLIPNIEVDI